MISNLLKGDLESTMPIEQVFQKHIVDGASYFFQNIINEPNYEYMLRHELASVLGISINDVVIMGSAKIGFSVKTDKFIEFDKGLNSSNRPKRSDIDIAIVNRDLFDVIGREIYALSRHFDLAWIKDKWRTNDFYQDVPDLYQKYALYLAKGWIRPDFMPLDYHAAAQWVSVKDAWRIRLDKRSIAIGFYSDWHYLKHYQMDNLDRLRAKLMSLGA